MRKSAPVNDLTLRDVNSQFGLCQTENSDFFPEWQKALPEMDDGDRRLLDRARADFLYLAEDSVHEEMRKFYADG